MGRDINSSLYPLALTSADGAEIKNLSYAFKRPAETSSSWLKTRLGKRDLRRLEEGGFELTTRELLDELGEDFREDFELLIE